MLIGVIITPFYLIKALINNIYSSPKSIYTNEYDMSSVSSAIITPIIPGINFPLRFAIIFWICYTIVTIIHELGHAIAALNEGLEIDSCGVFFAFLFPGAYVTIEDAVKYLPMIPQLRIYSGGIFGNFAFALICYLIMSMSSIGLTLGGYYRPEGIIVSHLPTKSVLYNNLHLGNSIKEVGNTPIRNTMDWLRAIDNVETSTNIFSYTWFSSRTIDSKYVNKGNNQANILTYTVGSNNNNKPTIINTTTRSINSIELKYNYSNHSSIINNNKDIIEKNQNNYTLTDKNSLLFSISYSNDLNESKKSVINVNNITNNNTNKNSNDDDDDDDDVENTRRRLLSNRVRIYTRAAGKGLCYDKSFLEKAVSDDIACCDNVFVLSTFSTAEGNYCFMHARNAFNSTTIYGPNDKTIGWMCAPTLHMYSESIPSCSSDQDCNEDSKCLRPVTKQISDRLVKIKYTDNSNDEKFLIFEGSLLLLSSTRTVGVSNYNSNWIGSLLFIKGLGYITKLFEMIYSFLITLPDMIYLSLWLCSQLSLSLAILNTLPIVSLDGGHAFPQIVRYFYPNKNWYDLSLAFIYPCTAILILNIILSMYKHNWF